MAMVYELELDV